MAHDSVDATRGFPQYAGTGAPADAADLSEIATWAGSNIDRIATTQANLLTAYSPLYTGMLCSVTAIPGALWRYDGTAFVMIGMAKLANFAAIGTNITSPAQGMQVKTADTGTIWQYFGLYNSGSNPEGANTAGWYPVGGFMPYIAARNLTPTSVTAAYRLVNADWGSPTDLLGFTYSAGAFTCTVAGWYRAVAHLKIPATATPLSLQLTLNSTTFDSAASVLDGAAGNYIGSISKVDASGDIKLAVGDILRMYVYSGATGTPANPVDMRLDLRYISPARF